MQILRVLGALDIPVGNGTFMTKSLILVQRFTDSCSLVHHVYNFIFVSSTKF